MQGRIAAYSHLFTEISPPIPAEYSHIFMVNGLLLPGYTIEGQTPQRSEKTAAEVLEALGGGFLLYEVKKASVLEKLTAAKKEHKAAAVTEKARKERAQEI